MATLNAPIAASSVRQTQCFIGGKWQPAPSGRTFETVTVAKD